MPPAYQSGRAKTHPADWPKETLVRARTGFTLVETLISVVVVSLLMMIAYPKVASSMAKSDLRSARGALVNATANARAAATESARTTWLKFEGDRAVVLARPRRTAGTPGSNADTIGVVLDLNESYGVTVAAGTDSIRFNPGGFGTDLAASETVKLWRGDHAEAITIDALGRVTK
jgi:prepilin-type N-terminal cleavage/methylation domain-containing protein